MSNLNDISKLKPSFKNSQYVDIKSNKIPLTLIMGRFSHFSAPDYTNFKVFFGTDQTSNNLSFDAGFTPRNSFGQTELQTIGVSGTKIISGVSNSASIPVSLQTDRFYDVYIDNITTFNIKPNTLSDSSPGVINTFDNMGFILSINGLSGKNATNMSAGYIGNSVFIPNDATATETTTVHKSKKLNYLATLPPTDLNFMSGKITNMIGGSIFPTPPTTSGTVGESVLVLDLLLTEN